MNVTHLLGDCRCGHIVVSTSEVQAVQFGGGAGQSNPEKTKWLKTTFFIDHMYSQLKIHELF